MRCKYCGTDHHEETDFLSLFSFDTACADCKKHLSEPPLFSRIPTDAVLVDLIVLYPSSNSLEVYSFLYHQKYGIALKEAIISKPEYSLVLYLDAAETLWIRQWFPLLSAYPRILFLKLAEDGNDPFVRFL